MEVSGKIVGVAAAQGEFGEGGEQLLLLRVGTMLQHGGEFDGELRFDGEAALNGAVAVFGLAQEGDPVVVEVADILVGQVVDGGAQIGFDPGVLRLRECGEQGVFDLAAHGDAGVPEPRLPEAADGLQADGDGGIFREA